jgi:uncharacterized cupin superfamily protein
MKHRTHGIFGISVGVALCAMLLLSVAVMAEEADAVRAVKLDPDKLAGINLPAGEPFILHYGEQLITEVYEDDPATFNIGEPTAYDEFVLVLSGKLVLTDADGMSQEYVAGDSLVVPKGFTGTWKMLGNFRELIVIEREAYEQAYGTGED